jgi:serine/threonine protein kinase
MKLETTISYLTALGTVAFGTAMNAPPCPDVLRASEIPSVRSKGYRDRVLADVDQDGLLFARDRQDRSVFNTRENFLSRKRNSLQVILLHGKVCLRKRFCRPLKSKPKALALHLLRIHFLTELAALKRLQPSGSVPRVLEANIFRRTIDMEFIAGHNLRQVIGSLHPVLDLDMRLHSALYDLSLSKRMEREFALCADILPEALRRDVLAAYENIHALRVIPRDLHPANIIIGRHSGRPYLIDFEIAFLGSAASRRRADQRESELSHKLKLGSVCGEL